MLDRIRYKLSQALLVQREASQIVEQSKQLAPYIDQPLILISQERRSGGTLMSQLFDAHPQIFCHPGEIKTGYPAKWEWAPIDVSKGWYSNFCMIAEGNKHLSKGYEKGKNVTERLLYFHTFFVTRELFRYFWKTYRPRTHRDIFNIHFSSYFGSWLNYTGRTEIEKKYIVGFVPQLMNTSRKVDRFFELYPDGKYIGIIKDPLLWLESAKRHEKYNGVSTEQLLRGWRASVDSIIQAKKKYAERTIVISFEDLIARTDLLMNRVAERLEIEPHSILSTPTFNGNKIESSSNRDGRVSAGAIDQRAIERDDKLRHMIDPEELKLSLQSFERAMDLVVKV